MACTVFNAMCKTPPKWRTRKWLFFSAPTASARSVCERSITSLPHAAAIQLVTESGGRTAFLGPAVLRLAEGVLLSVWRHGLLSPLDQLFRCALRARLRTRCQRLLCANMHLCSHPQGAKRADCMSATRLVCRQRPRRRIWRRCACNHPWRAERAGIFSGFCVSDDAIFASVRGSDGRICDACVRAWWRLTVGSDVTVTLLTQNVSVNVPCSVRCPLTVKLTD
jgi:hypothetical protein